MHLLVLQRASNHYDDLLARLAGAAVPLPVAVERVAGAYLDGRPMPVGKKKLTKKDRDSLFWSSSVVKECPPDSWNSEAMMLAFAHSSHCCFPSVRVAELGGHADVRLALAGLLEGVTGARVHGHLRFGQRYRSGEIARASR